MGCTTAAIGAPSHNGARNNLPCWIGCGESQAVHLVPISKLSDFLDSLFDHQVIALAYGIQAKNT